MTYILTYKGVKYNLSDYVQKIAIPFNTFYNEYKKSEDFKDKYKAACSACIVALGIDRVKAIFKDEETLDVNDVFMLVEEIHETYNRPLREYKIKNLKEEVRKLTVNLPKPDISENKLAKSND